MSTDPIENLIDDLFVKRGDYFEMTPDGPVGRGGITLANYRQFAMEMENGRRVSTLDLQTLSHEQARAILRWLVVQHLRKSFV